VKVKSLITKMTVYPLENQKYQSHNQDIMLISSIISLVSLYFIYAMNLLPFILGIIAGVFGTLIFLTIFVYNTISPIREYLSSVLSLKYAGSDKTHFSNIMKVYSDYKNTLPRESPQDSPLRDTTDYKNTSSNTSPNTSADNIHLHRPNVADGVEVTNIHFD
jgi:hypothetical protein